MRIKPVKMLLKKYTPNWIIDFTHLKREIEKGLIGLEYRIEHIGSTSVPSLDSKPIIDIDIVYFNPVDLEEIKSGLERTGYYHNGDQGIEGREVFKRNGKQTNKVLDAIRHHLYVCSSDSIELKRHLQFRDALSNDGDARMEYQAKKYQLAKEANQDQKVYAQLKEQYLKDFFSSII